MMMKTRAIVLLSHKYKNNPGMTKHTVQVKAKYELQVITNMVKIEV